MATQVHPRQPSETTLATVWKSNEALLANLCDFPSNTSQRCKRWLPHEAMDGVSKIALRASNQAVQRSEVFSDVQASGESVCEYFTRCSQKVLDCGFDCPACDSDITQYILLSKLAGGLHEPTLRCEVFQGCDQFDSVENLRAYCVVFEAAHKDAVGTDTTTLTTWMTS